ncbi:MAG TPA: saccharopine dehydrogenase C-terminal domain-containing protein [Acetobacteraceae bacterium]|nr:saccharopine dehydrogenase C-terminal domain-containing protein [Acetobacteraceae bacterium]
MPPPTTTHARLDGPLVMVGFGSIGKGTLPLILRHIDVVREGMVIIDPDDSSRGIADFAGIRFEKVPLLPETLRRILTPLLATGGFLVNLSVGVSSVALIELCRELGALYLDTCIEPPPGGYTDPTRSISERSNYAMRESALALRRRGDDPTAVIAHGANPGMVSHLVKRALLHLARDLGLHTTPAGRDDWARLARDLGIKGIHIAERDTQRARIPKQKDEFVNTWSIDGFLSEGMQPSELGWGTHERQMPPEGARHAFGCDAAIYLARPGAGTRVRSWTPQAGPIQGYLITHNEAISIADYLTLREDGRVVYRPTCHYAYHPCDDAILSLHELQGNAFQEQSRFRLMNEEIIDGIDELGVLLFGHANNAYWYGSQLSIEETRALAPYQNATALQVTSAVLAGMVWAIENPRRGVVEADELDHERILSIMEPYLGSMVGAYTDWTPVKGRGGLFPEDIDPADPWQFRNVIVR